MSDSVMPPNDSHAGGKKKKKSSKVAPQPQVQPDSAPSSEENFDSPVEGSSQEEMKEVPLDDMVKEMSLIDTNPENPNILIDTDVPVTPPTRPPRLRNSPSNREPPKPCSASPSLRPKRERTPSISYNKGQVVKATEVPYSSIVSTVAELVHDAFPKQHHQPAALPEKVEWVQFHSIEKAGDSRRKLDVLLLGLARGYQIWTIMDNDDFEEVLFEKQGAIRAFLPIPNNFEERSRTENGDVSEENLKNDFTPLRPLVALVDAYVTNCDLQYSTVAIISLTTKNKCLRLPQKGSFESPVLALHCSNRYLVVCLASRIHVFDTNTFVEVRNIRTQTVPEKCLPAVAVNGQFLAYPALELSSEIQSSGGLDAEEYSNQVMSVAKAITDTFLFRETPKAKKKANGIVTVVDLSRPADDESNNVIAHFAAHTDPLSYLTWSPDGRLLMTADINGSVFHIFNILPHPLHPGLGTAQHIYCLHRGNTSARILDTAFSYDTRWLAVATNHGTIHVFAICPFGGKPSKRTHSGKFANKESRFLRSAGLTEAADYDSLGYNRSRTNSGQQSFHKEHPLAHQLLSKSSGNSRIGPHPPPITLQAVAKIRDPNISTDNLVAWAQDLNPIGASTTNVATKKSNDLPRMSLTMCSRNKVENILYVCRAETGVVFQYKLEPIASSPTSTEDAPELKIVPMLMWILHTTKNHPDISPPLEVGSPLRAWATSERRDIEGESSPLAWIPHVEIKTYSGPTRRVWQGPQFSFFEYKDEDTPDLLAPSDNRNSLTKSIPVVIGDRSGTREHEIADTIGIHIGSYDDSPGQHSGDDIRKRILMAMDDISEQKSPLTRPPQDGFDD